MSKNNKMLYVGTHNKQFAFSVRVENSMQAGQYGHDSGIKYDEIVLHPAHTQTDI